MNTTKPRVCAAGHVTRLYPVPVASCSSADLSGHGIRNVWLQLHVQFLAKSEYYYYFIKPDGVKGSYLPTPSISLYLSSLIYVLQI
jgi:hypothetical protein